MTPATREKWIVAVTVLVLLGGVGWAWGMMTDARRDAIAAARETSDCRAIAARIGKPQEIPSSANKVNPVGMVSGQITQAATDAGIPPGGIERIQPEAAHREVGGSTAQSTQVSLRDVNLRQLLGLLHGLSSGEPAFLVERVHATSPRDAGPGGVWKVDLTLTRTVSSAQTAAEGAGVLR